MGKGAVTYLHFDSYVKGWGRLERGVTQMWPLRKEAAQRTTKKMQLHQRQKKAGINN